MCRSSLIIIAFGVCANSVAGASPQDRSSPGSTSHDAQAGTDTAAEQLFDAAHQRYVKGDLKAAVELLQQCFAVSQDPNLLFNIAQVHRELHDCAAATEYYELYIQRSADGERVADARKHISELRDACRVEQPKSRSTEAKPPGTVAAPTLETSRADYWPTVAWVSFGVSALAAAATTYFAVESQSAKRDVERMLQQPPFDAHALNNRLDDFYHDRNWATGAAVVTGISAATGVCVLIVRASERHTSRQTSFSVDAHGASIDLRWRF